MTYYKLVNKKTVPVENYNDIDMDLDDRQVAITELPNGGIVSTVFLISNDPENLFESMYFTYGWAEEECERYRTWDEAIEGHKKMVIKYGGSIKAPDVFEDREDLFEI